MFKIVKYFYGKGYYTKENVGVFVKAGRLTAEEYKLITNEDYTA